MRCLAFRSRLMPTRWTRFRSSSSIAGVVWAPAGRREEVENDYRESVRRAGTDVGLGRPAVSALGGPGRVIGPMAIWNGWGEHAADERVRGAAGVCREQG